MDKDRDRDWVESAESELDAAEDAGDEQRLEVLESINEKLEEDLGLDRPATPSGGSHERDETDASGH